MERVISAWKIFCSNMKFIVLRGDLIRGGLKNCHCSNFSPFWQHRTAFLPMPEQFWIRALGGTCTACEELGPQMLSFYIARLNTPIWINDLNRNHTDLIWCTPKPVNRSNRMLWKIAPTSMLPLGFDSPCLHCIYGKHSKEAISTNKPPSQIWISAFSGVLHDRHV